MGAAELADAFDAADGEDVVVVLADVGAANEFGVAVGEADVLAVEVVVGRVPRVQIFGSGAGGDGASGLPVPSRGAMSQAMGREELVVFFHQAPTMPSAT